MRILVVGDPHLKHTNLKLSIDFLRWIEQVCSEYKPDLVVNLGDTFPDHSVIRSEILCEFKHHLLRVKKPYAIILGNHDQFKPNDRSYHALEVFKGIKDVHVVDSMQVLYGMAFVPYLCKGEEWPEIEQDIVFTHNTFVGADFGFKLADTGIPLESVTSGLVISGHIHKRQVLSTESSQIIYPGTPYASSASDVDQEKGVMILDTETLKISYIKSPFPIWQKWNLDLSVDDYMSLFDNLNVKNHHVVTITGPRAEVKALLTSKDVEEVKKTHSITFKTDFTDKVKSDKKSIKVSSASTMVKDFISTIYKGQIDRDSLEKEALKYIGDKDE